MRNVIILIKSAFNENHNHDVIILMESVFNENHNHYYYKVFLKKCSKK